MIRALGVSANEFDATDPGRLCRGRERWIEPYELDREPPLLHRTVVTGATFSDDTAADALRGVPHSGIDVATLITTLFPRKPLLAFMEDGHPADIPEGALGVEMYTGHRAGGRSEALMVRWCKEVNGLRELREVLGPDQEDARVLGFALLEPDVPIDDALFDRLFPLVGMSCLDSPPARFQPSALPEVLDVARAVILLHRDKHGPVVGVYSREALALGNRLQQLCEKGEALLVNFAIPPMLARWDRAIAELRGAWDPAAGPFPVPAGPEVAWEPRRRGRRNRRDKLAREAKEAADAVLGDAYEDDLDDPGDDPLSGPDDALPFDLDDVLEE